MITAAERLRQLEREYQRTAYTAMTFGEGLARFAALWSHARLVNPHLGENWMDDLEPDFAVARAVNGLPPA